MELLSNLLTRLRTSRGLSKAEAARLSGITRQAWQALEDGTSKTINQKNLHQVAKALGVSVNQLIGESSQNMPVTVSPELVALYRRLNEEQRERLFSFGLDLLSEKPNGNNPFPNLPIPDNK